ncbi:DsbA family protein [Stappia taiwanensis]|uniref:DsbA family protein n=1 Tax=Stappia taiwanensis TaxID=992267 RepID=A0A838XX83_9HYPH|nr:DsbA family protein [Stappia taiwanensis]MBA4613671.1 DsbA family protein [Stappia taiwanensis]GGE81560.1 DSBA oxidoreductase [Stappia taiwanensis]
MITRRNLLAGSAAGIAASAAGFTLLPAALQAQGMPTVKEVLFDPEIPVLGNPKGDVTIAEFFDYQCPYCKKAHPDLMEVVKADGNIRLVMKDWPIFGAPSFHAATMALAAQKSGAYPAAVAALMATDGRLSLEEINTALRGAGLDPAALQAAHDKKPDWINGILRRNDAQAEAFRFGGTPSYIVGTRIYNGVMDKKALLSAIADARKG